MVKNTKKLFVRFFLHKISKKKKKKKKKNAKKSRGEMFSTFAGMMSLMLNGKTFDFITS